MKVIQVMFDTLNRRFLPPYGCDWTVAPNFQRLAERCCTFDNAWTGSLPCMPARRELHTGRYNFLHRSWGPIEPFDDSCPEILTNNGVYTHLTSDHAHYWEDGGATYHYRYNSWTYHRGQEGDPYIGQVAEPEFPPDALPECRRGSFFWRHDWVNRPHMKTEADQPQAKTFADGLEFIHRNHDDDRWFLHIETFDPHEPFFTQQEYKDLYPHDYDGPHFDWPGYGRVTEDEKTVEHVRYEYAALLSMCDRYLGKVLSLMDEYDLWDDTMLIVNTDHGFLLGEHDWWAKCCQPFYNEVAHMPLFIWDPRSGVAGVHRQALVQTIDIPATILDFFEVERPPDMQGISLRQTIADDTQIREAALFGIHGGHVNITDGRYVYMRGPQGDRNAPLHEYTLMPTHMHHPFDVSELQDIDLAEPFAFTKGCRTMKIEARKPALGVNHRFPTMLFDLETDPAQDHPYRDADIEGRLCRQMSELMAANDAPPEQWQRLALDRE